MAFDELVRKYYKPLTAYAFRYVVMEDAEEIIQDLLMWIWEKRDTFAITTSLQSYLFHSVYYRCLSCIERNSTSKRLDDKIWENSFVDSQTPLDYFNTEELRNRIDEALDKLPDEFREAFVMQRFHGKTYQEIAEELNVSPGIYCTWEDESRDPLIDNARQVSKLLGKSIETLFFTNELDETSKIGKVV